MFGDLFRHSDPCHLRRIQWNDSLVATFELYGIFRFDLDGQRNDGLGKCARMVNIRNVGLRNVLNALAVHPNRTPIERGGNLQRHDLLRLNGIVAQSDLAARAQPLLFGLKAHFQVVPGDGESFPVKRRCGNNQTSRQTKKQTKPTKQSHDYQLHDFLDAPSRLCRTTSYSTTPAATDTFNDGT